MALTRTRRHINTALGLILLGTMAYLIWPFASDGSTTKAFCASLQPGSSVSEVRAAVSAAGYEVTDLSSGHGYVHSTRSLGRFTCELQFGSAGLESAQFNSAD